ncbi:hypothetical protein M513_13096 [Trichuris suis]|uniref:Uncharacterized protein n=1 Tax=Trichuris suis TaxID=68888 RepID=A0A085LM41_9BILA|nr:hypothetical protein M513_13096 [Trichuris suis]
MHSPPPEVSSSKRRSHPWVHADRPKPIRKETGETFYDLLNVCILHSITGPLEVSAAQVELQVRQSLIGLQSNINTCQHFDQFGKGF